MSETFVFAWTNMDFTKGDLSYNHTGFLCLSCNPLDLVKMFHGIYGLFSSF